MKKTILYLIILLLSLGVFSTSMMASEKNATIPTPTPKEVPAYVQNMLNRIDEIKEMDKSTLSRAERKELRNEVREINKEIRSTGNGVYLSVGAIIVILLLIIIL